MLRYTLLFAILFIPVFYSYSLIDEEIYYNGEKTEITGKKIYYYDNSNIKLIDIIDSYSNVQIKLKYFYENELLVGCEEYNGKIKVKYSKFIYDNNQLIKKIDYDNSNKIILMHEYFYDDNKNLIIIENLFESGEKFGKTIFIYQKNLLTEEIQYDQNNKIILTKKYLYKENKINTIEFYTQSETKIRNIERKYSGIVLDENKFGFRTNFLDIR